MSAENVDELSTHILKRMDDDIQELKANDKKQDERLYDLEKNDSLQDKDIGTLRTSLSKIDENTEWIRRTITKAIITSAFGAGFSLVAGLSIWYLTTK